VSRAAILAALRAEPNSETVRLVAADWFADAGDPLAESQLRSGPPPVGLVFFGYGSGYGGGDGSGSGYGYGDGYGYGSGYGRITLGEHTMPEVGGNWLIVLPHGWVICGFVEEQTGPFQFRVREAVVICRTGGVPWDELADGKRRESATYRKWGDVRLGPQFVMSRPWVGDLPKVK